MMTRFFVAMIALALLVIRVIAELYFIDKPKSFILKTDAITVYGLSEPCEQFA